MIRIGPQNSGGLHDRSLLTKQEKLSMLGLHDWGVGVLGGSGIWGKGDYGIKARGIWLLVIRELGD